MTAGKSRRRLIVNGVIVLVVLLAAGGTVFGLTRSSSSINPALRTTPLGRGTVARTVTASGTVTSATSATLNFSTSGKIAEVRVRLGDHVEKGQTVARLDSEYAQANLNAADAQVASAQQALDDAEYSKAHPQPPVSTAAPAPATPAAATPAARAQATATGTRTTGAPAPAPGPAPAAPAQPAPVRPHGLLGDWFAAPATGVMAAGPVPAQAGTAPTPIPTPAPTPSSAAPPAGRTGTTSSVGAGSSVGTAATSADPGEAQVKSAEATLAQAKATQVLARQATENLDLITPQAGTVVSLDGLVGQVAGPQGIVVSSTATGNPAGGRLPDGSAISSGAGSGQAASGGGSPTAGASGASGASGSAAGGAGSGSAGSGVTAAPTAPAVMTIADLSGIQVLAQVPELDIGQVTGGQPVAVSVNALPGQRSPA